MTCPSDPPIRRHRQIRQIFAVVGAATVALLACSAPAQAHTELTFSQPDDGARLDRAPREVRLQFNEPLTDAFVRVTLTVDGGQPVRAPIRVQNRLVVATVPSSIVSAAGDASRAAQRWQVAYRVASQDGHPVTGALRFSVKASATPTPGASPSPTGPQEPQSDRETDENVDRAAPTSGTTGEGDAWRSTATVGLVAALATGAALVWVARGRRRDKHR